MPDLNELKVRRKFGFIFLNCSHLLHLTVRFCIILTHLLYLLLSVNCHLSTFLLPLPKFFK